MSILKSVKSGNIVLNLKEFETGEKFTLKGDNSSSNAEFILNTSSNAYSTKLKSATVTSDISFVLPPNDGNDNQLFTSDGSGNFTFTDNSFNVDQDTSPVLSANLDINSNNFVSVNNNDISIVPNGSGTILMDGDGSNSGTGSGGIIIENGSISIKNSGSVSSLSLYCESSNAHYTKVQSSPHSSYTGNVTLTLPATTSTLGYASNIPHNYGEQSFVASGAISAGNIVGLKSDGTVEVIDNIYTSYSNTKDDHDDHADDLDTNGGPNSNVKLKALFDPSVNKILVTYVRISGGNNKVWAAVGTISGTAITFSSEVDLQTLGMAYQYDYDVVYDSNSSQFVIIYSIAGNSYWRGRVFSISSSSVITLGNIVSDNTAGKRGDQPIATFDTNLNKVVFTYRSVTHGNYRGALHASVSGTGSSATLFFGQYSIISSVIPRNINPVLSADTVFDPNSNKVITCYTTNQAEAMIFSLVYDSTNNIYENANYSILNLGTYVNYSGTDTARLLYHPPSNKIVYAYRNYANGRLFVRLLTIPQVGATPNERPTYTSEVEPFGSGRYPTNSIGAFQIGFDSYLNKIILACSLNTFSNSVRDFRVILGDISSSGTISFGNQFEILNSSGNSYTAIGNPGPGEVVRVDGIAYDTNSKKYVVVFFHQYTSTGNTVSTALMQAAGSVITSTNADSWIGLAKENISDGATGKINIKNGVNSSQSGLTANTSYYVDRDGTLSTSSTTYGKIGKALSATKLLITQGNA